MCLFSLSGHHVVVAVRVNVWSLGQVFFGKEFSNLNRTSCLNNRSASAIRWHAHHLNLIKLQKKYNLFAKKLLYDNLLTIML